MKSLLSILAFISIVAGVLIGLLYKDLRILGLGIIGCILFWTLGFTIEKNNKNEP